MKYMNIELGLFEKYIAMVAPKSVTQRNFKDFSKMHIDSKKLKKFWKNLQKGIFFYCTLIQRIFWVNMRLRKIFEITLCYTLHGHSIDWTETKFKFRKNIIRKYGALIFVVLLYSFSNITEYFCFWKGITCNYYLP